MFIRLLLIFIGFIFISGCRAGLVPTMETPLPPNITPPMNNKPQNTPTPLSALPNTSSEPKDGPTPGPPAPPTVVPTSEPPGEPVFIPATDPRIRIIGRFAAGDFEHLLFDWSAVAIEASFSGRSIAIQLQDGLNHYNVTVDNLQSVLITDPQEDTYLLAEGLPAGEHTVRLTKRTEAYVGPAAFSGFILDPGHDLLSPPPAKGRWLEFVGDSITTGYGNEGLSPDCWFTAETQNVANTYAGLTAAHFDAEYTIIALSGLGVVRNLRDSTASSPETAVDFLDRALAMNPSISWENTAGSPDAVVVNLGTNDFSSLPFPDQESFITAYVSLLEAIRRRYPSVPIVAVAGPLMLGPAPDYIAAAVERLNQDQEAGPTTFLFINNTLGNDDFGCDFHPNVSGHEKIAAELIPVIAGVLNW